MDPETIKTIFDIGSAVTLHILEAVERNDSAELRRLSDVWPEAGKLKMALLADEAEARRRVKETD